MEAHQPEALLGIKERMHLKPSPLRADSWVVIPRRPGEFAARHANVLVLGLLLPCVLGALVGLLLGAELVLILAVALGLIPVFARPEVREILRWRQGQIGEETVGRILEAMAPAGFRCLHDLDTGHGNVDHVAIGPTGVFAIETKAWARRVWLASEPTRLMAGGRDETAAIRQATHAAMEVKRRAAKENHRIWVEAVVVVTRTRLARGPISLRHVTILDVDQLPGFLKGGTSRLDPGGVVRIANAILRDGTPVVARSLGMD